MHFYSSPISDSLEPIFYCCQDKWKEVRTHVSSEYPWMPPRHCLGQVKRYCSLALWRERRDSMYMNRLQMEEVWIEASSSLLHHHHPHLFQIIWRNSFCNNPHCSEPCPFLGWDSQPCVHGTASGLCETHHWSKWGLRKTHRSSNMSRKILFWPYTYILFWLESNQITILCPSLKSSQHWHSKQKVEMNPPPIKDSPKKLPSMWTSCLRI